jgi:predicted ribosomally synthesized peptide with SipW-like signal peptide
MSRKRIKQYLLLLTAVGLIAVAASGAGTFASFSAETTNSGNTFATGTLFLHDTHGTTTCKSEDDSGNAISTGCDQIFDGIAIANGTVTKSTPLTLENDGTIDATDIKFGLTDSGSGAGCSIGDNGASTSSTATFGTVTCSDLEFAIEEVDGSGATPNVIGCAYGTPANASDPTAGCAFDTSHTFGSAAIANPSQLALNLQPDVNSNTGTDLTSKQSRYFRLEVEPVVANDNDLQNRNIGFGITWHVDQ